MTNADRIRQMTDDQLGEGLTFVENRILEMQPMLEREALEALENAWQICNREPEEYEFRIRGELSHFAALLFAHRNPVKESYPMAEQRREERIKQMLTFIREHYAEDINPELFMMIDSTRNLIR